jgi:hypothetical protein
MVIAGDASCSGCCGGIVGGDKKAVQALKGGHRWRGLSSAQRVETWEEG